MTTTVVLTGTPGVTIRGSKTAGTPSLRRDGLSLPDKRPRVTYAPDSADIHGSVALASVWQQGLLTMLLRVEAATEAAFKTLKGDLEATVGQFTYQAQVTVDGSLTTWTCDPGAVAYTNGTRTRLTDAVVVEYLTVTIPVYPIGT